MPPQDDSSANTFLLYLKHGIFGETENRWAILYRPLTEHPLYFYINEIRFFFGPDLILNEHGTLSKRKNTFNLDGARNLFHENSNLLSE